MWVWKELGGWREGSLTVFLIFLNNLVVNSSQHVNLICTSLLMIVAPEEEEEEEEEFRVLLDVKCTHLGNGTSVGGWPAWYCPQQHGRECSCLLNHT